MEIVFKEHTLKELQTLNEAHLLYDFKDLKQSYEHIRLALYFLKILNQTKLSRLDTSIFDLLLHSLRSLEKTKKISALKLQFEVKFLSLQGVLEPSPDLVPFLKTSLYKSEVLNQKTNIGNLTAQVSFQIENYIERSLKP